jgi:ferrous iron transport protein A
MSALQQGLPALFPNRVASKAPVESRAVAPAGLHEMEIGTRAIVGAPTSFDATTLRLLEMGLTPGAEVVLTRRAPSRDPVEIRLRGTRLCLRLADAARFPVTVIAARADRG